MNLRCYNKDVRCPAYDHSGTFQPDNETITRFLPDLKRCANCMAYSLPKMPDYRDDLQQIATLTLFEKGVLYNPKHKSNASFGTFIRPRICGNLINAKNKEMAHNSRFSDQDNGYSDFIGADYTNFVEEFIWDETLLNFEKSLPKLLAGLTHRENQVFALVRQDIPNKDIAKILNLSAPRISKLVKQVESKLKTACKELMLI